MTRKYLPYTTRQGRSDVHFQYNYMQGTDSLESVEMKRGEEIVHTTTFEYSGPGGLTVTKTIPSPSGDGDMKLKIEKSNSGKQILKVFPDEGEVSSFYNAHGQVIKVVDPKGATTTKSYNSLGFTTKQCKPDLGCESFEYDKNGRVLKKTNGNGEVTEYSFDKNGRPLTKKDSDGRITKHLYHEDELQKGLLWQITDGYGNKENIHYDRNGVVKQTDITIDGKKYVTKRNKLGQTILPTGDVIDMTETFRGFANQVKLNGKVIARITALDQHDSSITTEFGNGNLASAQFDDFGKVTGIRVTQSGRSLFEENLTFDDRIGKLKSVSRNDLSVQTEYSYDQMGRLIEASNNQGHNETYEYDSNSNIVKANDNTVYYMGQEGSSRVYSIRGEGKIPSVDYLYDKAGRVIEKTKEGKTWSFKYESHANQVTEINGPEGKTTFIRNSAGSALKTIRPNGSVTINASPGLEINKSANGTVTHTISVGFHGKKVYSKTSSGNGVAAIKMDKKIEYNAYKLSAGMFDPTKIIQFTKNKLGQFLSRPNLEHELMKGFCLSFAIGLLLSIIVNIFRKRAVGKVKWWHYPILVAIFTVTTSLPVYAMEPGANGIGEPEIGEQYFHSDHLGNTAIVADESGKVTANTLYDSFGKMLSQSKGKDNFRDKWSQAEHLKHDDGNLRLMGARIYDMEARRFLSPDPKNVFHSPYRYSSDPIMQSDPSGEEPFTIACIVVFAILGFFTVGSAISGTMNPFKWSGKTWGYALMGALAGGLFAAAGAAALPAITASFGASSGIGAAAAGTAGVTSSAGLKSLALHMVVFGVIGAGEAATIEIIKQHGNNSVNGRAFDWSAVGNAAKAGGYAGALGTFATAIAVSVAKPLLTKLAQKLAKSTNIGNTRFGKFIKSSKFQAFLGESTDDVVGKGYSGGSPADPYDLGMNWGKNAAGWKRYSMNGVTSELRWYKAGVIFKIATNDAMRVMAFFDNDGPWTNIRYVGGFASKNWAYHGFNEGWLRGFMDSMGVGQATYYAPEAYGNDMCTYGSCSSNSGGDFGLVGCDPNDTTCGR